MFGSLLGWMGKLDGVGRAERTETEREKRLVEIDVLRSKYCLNIVEVEDL